MFRLLGLLGGLSLTTDLGTGAPMEESLERSLVATRLARSTGCTDDEVRAGVSKVGEINSQMGQILEQMRASNEGFQAVNEGTAQQSAGARQINDAMVQLAAGVQQTSASLKEFHQVTVNLRESADALKQQVSRFTVAG